MKYALLLSLVRPSAAIAAPAALDIAQNAFDRAERIIKEHHLLTPKAL